MRQRLGLWTAVVALLAIGGIVGWRTFGRGWARLFPGATLVLTIEETHPYDVDLTPEQARVRTLTVLRDRVAKVAPYALVRVDGDRVEVQLARGDSPERVARVLTRSGRLEFKVVDDGTDYMKRVALAVTAGQPADVAVGSDHWTERDGGAPHDDVYLRAADLDKLLDAPHRVPPMPPMHALAFERHTDDDNVAAWRTYYVWSRAELTGDRISDVELTWDQQTGRPEVSLAFDQAGAKIFESMTARAVGKKLAIILEGEVTSAPVVESKIAGGRARISLGANSDPFKLQAGAKELVAILRVGGLAAPVTLAETRAAPTR
jgi:preprotein translocase subunit SecD